MSRLIEDWLAAAVAGDGISGGAGDALALDINGLTVVTTPAEDDTVAIYDASGTVIRKITRQNFVGGFAHKKFSFAAEYDNGNSGTAKTIDWNNGQNQKIVLNGICTFTFTAPTVTGTCVLKLKMTYPDTTSRATTWPATVKWLDNTQPTHSYSTTKLDLFAFYWDGTNYLGQMGAFGA